MRITQVIAIMLTGALLIPSACVRPAVQPAPPPVMAATVTIIFDNDIAYGRGVLYGGEFRPRTRTVAVGATVTWNNTDNKPHTVVSNDGLFNQRLGISETFSYTFTGNGTFNYHDEVYDDMDGTIYVESINAPR